MNDEDVLRMVETLHRAGVRAELRIGTLPETGRVVGRSWYYDGEERLLITTYEPVDAVDLPDHALDDEDRGHAYYLRATEGFYRVDEEFEGIRPDSDVGGWFVEESVEFTYEDDPIVHPVNREGEVVRQAENQPVPVFLTYQHHNLRDDVFDDGGEWSEVMRTYADDEEDEPEVRTDGGEDEFEDEEAREQPVDPYSCLWCKLPMSDAPVDLRYHELDTGEVFCANCLGDARQFKRGVHVMPLASVDLNDVEEGLTGRVTGAMMDAAEEVLADAGVQFDTPAPFYLSNASGREENEVEESAEVERKASLSPTPSREGDEPDEGDEDTEGDA